MYEVYYWIIFLNQDMVFMDGVECIVKMMDFLVFYCELWKEWRGYCWVDFDLVIDCLKEIVDGEIIEIFVCRLEQIIWKELVYWLWLYKCWKLKCFEKKNEQDICCYIELEWL